MGILKPSETVLDSQVQISANICNIIFYNPEDTGSICKRGPVL